MTTESHRMEVVAEAKQRRKAIAWEVFGLLIVLVVGGALLALLATAIMGRHEALEAEKARLAAAQKPEFVPVDVRRVAPEAVRDSIRIPGLVFANIEVKTPVEVAGRVMEKLAEEGRAVKKGDILLRIDPRDYAIRMRRAESSLGLARLQRDRLQTLARQKAVSQSELDAAEAGLERAVADHEDAALALERCEVRSPIDGDVSSIKPEIGEWLEAGNIVADIIDISKVKVKVGISERDIYSVRDLRECDLIAESVNGGLKFTGRRTNLSLTPVENTQVYALELEADNRQRLLRPGMFVEADLVRAVRNHSVLIPAFAVMTTTSSTYEVAVVRDIREEPATAGPEGAAPLPPERYGRAARLPVKLGAMQGGLVEIILAQNGGEGLVEGDYIVLNGQRTLDEGANVRIRRELADLSEIER